MMKFIQGIVLSLLLLLRPLGAAAATRVLSSPSTTAQTRSTGTESNDDDDDDNSEDQGTVKHVDNSDDDDDEEDDTVSYTDAVDAVEAAEDAGEVISGNVSLASDYILRGLTQTDHEPAIQGGFDWTHPTGIYLGLWGSSVHFPDEVPSLELDAFGGYSYRINEDWRVSVGAAYLAYFQNEGRNSWDFPARVEWRTLSLEISYSPRWAGLNGDSWYFLGGWSDTLIWDLTLGGFVGYSTFSAGAEAPDYWDFRATVSHRFLAVDLGLAGVFVSEQEINDANGGPRAIFSVSKTF